MKKNFNSLYTELLSTIKTENKILKEGEGDFAFGVSGTGDRGASLGKVIGAVGSSIYSFTKYKLLLKKFIVQAKRTTISLVRKVPTIKALPRTNLNERAKFETKVEEIKAKVQEWLSWLEKAEKNLLIRATQKKSSVNLAKTQLKLILSDLRWVELEAVYQRGRTSPSSARLATTPPTTPTVSPATAPTP